MTRPDCASPVIYGGVSSTPLPENDIAREIVDASFKIHKAMVPGLRESVYPAVLAHELVERGLSVQREVPIAIG